MSPPAPSLPGTPWRPDIILNIYNHNYNYIYLMITLYIYYKKAYLPHLFQVSHGVLILAEPCKDPD